MRRIGIPLDIIFQLKIKCHEEKNFSTKQLFIPKINKYHLSIYNTQNVDMKKMITNQ
jgi:hypothetical protein